MLMDTRYNIKFGKQFLIMKSTILCMNNYQKILDYLRYIFDSYGAQVNTKARSILVSGTYKVWLWNSFVRSEVIKPLWYPILYKL